MFLLTVAFGSAAAISRSIRTSPTNRGSSSSQKPKKSSAFAAVDCYAGATIPNLIPNQFYILNHIFSYNISVLLD